MLLQYASIVAKYLLLSAIVSIQLQSYYHLRVLR